MRGLGRATGAITIVNALPSGVGCALGIGLGVEAEVETRPTTGTAGRRGRLWETDGISRTPLIEAAMELALERYAGEEPFASALKIHSEIPMARGLKSSSAVASAVGRAVASAWGKSPEPPEIARFSAEVGRLAGVSATGALDDALAGLGPGFVVTDNSRDAVLRTGPAGPDWMVALFVPRTAHRPSPEWLERFRAARDRAQAAVDAALVGNWWTAMARNTELVEEVMGYDYQDARAGLLEAGAFGAGVSGLGPTLAAVGPAHRAQEMLASLPERGGDRRLVALRPGPGMPVGVPR